MAKPDLAKISTKLYELLSPLSSEERGRAIQATIILFGDPPIADAISGTSPRGTRLSVGSNTPHGFMEEKAPANKGETFAVAARYRELVDKRESHSKADLKKVITDARRNFDNKNFGRDIKNARRQAGFFNLGTGPDSHTLSYYGQQYVDALPDREAASKLKRPTIRRATKKATRSTKPR